MTNGEPGAAPMVGLAAILPVVLAFSHLPKDPSFGLWILALVPSAYALWRIAGDDRPLAHAPFLAVGLAAAAVFVSAMRNRRAILGTLGLLAIEVWLVAYSSSGHGSGGAMHRWLLAHGASPPQRTLRSTRSARRST